MTETHSPYPDLRQLCRDTVQAPGEAPLFTLLDIARTHLGEAFSTNHLPFFPYSSDDGFAVIDYRQVRPDLGTWDERLGSVRAGLRSAWPGRSPMAASG